MDGTTRWSKASRALLLLGAVVVLVAGLRAAAALVVPLLLAAIVASATAPIVDWLRAHRVPTWAAVTLTVVAVLAVLAGFGFLLVSGLSELSTSLPDIEAHFVEAQGSVAAWLVRGRMTGLAHAVRVFDPSMGIQLLVTGAMAGAATYVSSFWIVLLVAVFILLESATFRDKLIRAAAAFTHKPDSDRDAAGRADQIGATVREVQKFMLVKTAVSAATGIAVGLLNLAIGMRHPELWGLIAFALNYVPTIGSAVAAVPAVVLAFAELGVGPGLVSLIGYFVINTALGNVIEPRLLGRALGLSPLVVLLSVIFWGWVLGPMGALLSVPLTMIVKIVLSRTDDLRWVAVLLAPGEAEREERRAERRRRRRHRRRRDTVEAPFPTPEQPPEHGPPDHGATASSG